MSIMPPGGILDQGVAWHYGDPFGEQRLLQTGAGVVDLSNRGVLTVTGVDRLSWLNDLTTQLVNVLSAGESALALILSPNGHVEYELHLVDDGQTTWIITQPGQAEGLLKYLDSMRFMLRVEVADVSQSYAVVYEPIQDIDPQLPTWLVPEHFAQRGLAGRELVLPRSTLADRLSASPQVGTWAFEASRVAAGMPRMNCETDHRTIPNEVDWLGSAVHLNKGCYRGQETVAKVHNLGQPPRRLALIHLDGSTEELPAHGDVVIVAGKTVGWIGTAARHFEEGNIALAVLKRNVAFDAPLVVDHNGELISAVEDPAPAGW
ncbi:MAG: folate-binding protein [Actinomycetota bacterium]|nr:folate-binding protein [Actinomycetota bacterium]